MLFQRWRSNLDITLYINNAGGSVTAAMAVYDAMNQLRSDVCTVCIGTAASMGHFCFLELKVKDLRCQMLDYDPSIVSTQGKASDIEVVAKEILYLRESTGYFRLQYWSIKSRADWTWLRTRPFHECWTSTRLTTVDRIITKHLMFPSST